METDDLNYIYNLHHPTEWTGFFTAAGGAQSVDRPLLKSRVVFSRHQITFSLSRAVVIATHWLSERSVCSHWMWLTSHDWVNEAMWQQRLVIWFIIFRDRHFLTPEIAHQLSFYFVREQIFLTDAHSPGFFGCEGEVPHQPDIHNMIILVDLCIRRKICSLAWKWKCKSIGYAIE